MAIYTGRFNRPIILYTAYDENWRVCLKGILKCLNKYDNDKMFCNLMKSNEKKAKTKQST